MDPNLKKILKALSLELRHLLEGWYDAGGAWHAGDLEQRLAGLGVWRGREPLPADEFSHLPAADRAAREVVDAYLALRREAGVPRGDAVAEFVRETAYTWANRLLALRCMEARGLIDEVILQRDAYAGRSLEHHRLIRQQPELALAEDDGLFAALDAAFGRQAGRKLALFDPHAPAVALKPSVAALRRCVALLSGLEPLRGAGAAAGEVFQAPDALGWAYQYYQEEEKARIEERLRISPGAKCEGADIVAKTALYTEPYMVSFLVQNSLGALWMGMHSKSRLYEKWEYYIRDADRAPVTPKPVREISFLDPATGSGHFHLEAFDLFYDMYLEEGEITDPAEICAAILAHNLYGIDIDERAIQIAEAALWMKAAERAFDFPGAGMNLVATNIRLPRGQDHLGAFLAKHPEDRELRPALEAIFEGLAHADELGSLLQIEEPVERELRYLRAKAEAPVEEPEQPFLLPEMEEPKQGLLPLGLESYDEWRRRTVARLKAHFYAQAEEADPRLSFFGRSASKGVALFDLLARRFDVVAANPPYLGTRQQGRTLFDYLTRVYTDAKEDLYAAFLLRGSDLVGAGGIIGFVVQQGIFFTGSYEPARKEFLEKIAPVAAVRLGPGAFSTISGEVVNSFMICGQLTDAQTLIGTYIDVSEARDKEPELLRAIHDTSRQYRRKRLWFAQLPGQPLAFWLPANTVELYKTLPNLGDCLVVKQGLATTNNPRFYREWWEVPSCGDRWVPIMLSAGTERWWSNYTARIDWQYDGKRLRNLIRERHGTESKRIYSQSYYFREGVSFGRYTGGALAVRYMPEGFVLDNSSPCAFAEEDIFAVLAFLNSASIVQIADALNPTSSFQVGDLNRLPYPLRKVSQRLATLGREAVAESQDLLERSPSSYGFRPPSSCHERALTDWCKDQLDFEAKTIARIRELDQAVDEEVVNLLGIPLTDNEVTASARSYPRVWDGNVSDGIADLFTVTILRLLGHRWPKQLEAGEPISDSADPDGIIPLTEGVGEPTLHDRVRERIAADFPGGSVTAIEAEFAEIMGKPLAQWLTHDFFKHHTSQFKKRPIAWQIGSSRFTARRRPAFACLVYYHKLDGDTLAAIQSQYVRPLRGRYETELRGIEAIPAAARSERQAGRRIELEGWIAELREFDDRLGQVATGGFASDALAKLIAQEPVDSWCSVDGIRPRPADREALLRQEMAYIPDLNDGVRVNIAPLQKAGLLAADVIAGKDVEKAIADRAEWRADERRWCREGKLPRPGWWRGNG